MKKDSKKKPEVVDYEKLGHMMQSLVETGYVERNKIYKMSFIKGVLGGLGGVIGATLVVGVLLWALSLFNEVPFLNRLTENLRNTINTTETFRP
jgi:tetrahydromethanopterin S-methyltransferase subunit D